MRSWPHRLAALMAERGMSQTELARLLDPEHPERWRPRVNKYLGFSSGRPSRMGEEVAQQICDALNRTDGERVTVDDLLDKTVREAPRQGVPQEALDLLAAQVGALDAKLETLEAHLQEILDELRSPQGSRPRYLGQPGPTAGR